MSTERRRRVQRLEARPLSRRRVHRELRDVFIAAARRRRKLAGPEIEPVRTRGYWQGRRK